MYCMRHLQSLYWGIFEPCICCTAIRNCLEMVSKKSHPQLGLRHIIFQPLLHGDVSSCPRCSVAPASAGGKDVSHQQQPSLAARQSPPSLVWLGRTRKTRVQHIFKTRFVFHLLKWIFSVFLPLLKCQINIGLKKIKSSISFFLWIVTYTGSLPHSPFNPQIPTCCTISFPWERTWTCSLLAKLKSAKINLVPRHWQLGVTGI